MIVAAEMARGGQRAKPFDWQERRGLRVYRHGLEHEALLRPIGNVVYFMPPVRDHAGRDRSSRHDGPRRHPGGNVRLTRVLRRRAAGNRRRPAVAGGRRLSRRPRAATCVKARPSSRSTAAGSEYRCEILAVTGDRVLRTGRRQAPGPARVAAAHHAGAGGFARRAHGLDTAESDRTRRAHDHAGAFGAQRRAARRQAGRRKSCGTGRRSSPARASSAGAAWYPKCGRRWNSRRISRARRESRSGSC